MSMLTNLDLIRRVPLFSMLTNDQAQAIADSVVKRRFRRGELVVPVMGDEALRPGQAQQ